MGYRIVYGEDPFAGQPRGKGRLRILTAVFALAFVILVRCFWPQGRGLLAEVLLPGEQAAFEQMRGEIQSGEPIGDAVTAFCQRIVEEAIGQAD